MASERSGTIVSASPTLDKALAEYRDQYDTPLLEISNMAPTLVVFLRHFGCLFCRETLSDLHDLLPVLERTGVKPVLVHMGSEEEAFTLFARYGLAPLSRINSQSRLLYKVFGLSRAKTGEFLCPDAVVRCGQALMSGHTIGKVQGDLLQMPGVFLVHRGNIINSFRHKHAGDRPDYLKLSQRH